VNKYTFHEPTQVPVMVLTAAAIPFATTVMVFNPLVWSPLTL